MDPVESYLKELCEIRSTGGAVDETSYYSPLNNLLNEIGKKLKPKVKCINILKDMGAGHPDFGLFSADQFRSKDIKPVPGQIPACGVIEAKPIDDDSWLTADSKQVAKYWKRYSQVLVTNYRDFVFVGRDENGEPVKLETFRLAKSEDDFWKAARQPRKTSHEQGERLIGYMRRVIQYSAALKNPEDLAWFLASYAREARARVESIKDLPGLAMLRKGLGDAVGMQFTGDEGERFFRAMLIETLFYGIFSSWVIWSRSHREKNQKFNWHDAAWNLHVPMIASLFEQIATPKKLKPLGIDEVLDWTGAVLNRVDRPEFFRHFEEEHAVQYFYEPFLEAYDPDLRKQLGVWYTPPEIIQYQVERIDTVLREELDIADGLADGNVYVLDPCCGTGGYLVEVIRKIHQTLKAKGGDALTAQQLKKAAGGRIFGFEILPAPFVIAHLQLGLLLRELGAPLSDKREERAGVYLTNALTGWEPPKKPKDRLPFPELQEEKDAAEKVKREVPILVILGNPPYNAFAGTSPEEEGGLVDAYKEGLNRPVKEGGWGIKKFNLDDLYIRFFRIAERRIAKGGKGIVSFISNFSYLGEPSFVVMRSILLKEFDGLWFDCMNGDSRETGKLTPEGRPDPSVFSTEYNTQGIRVGTSISLMIRKEKRAQSPTVRFRHFWGVTKRKDLLNSVKEKNITKHYKKAQPTTENRYSFRPGDVSEDYLKWPKITQYSDTKSHNGPVERRGNSLIIYESETDQLVDSLKKYFDPKYTDQDIRIFNPQFMKSSGEFDATQTRNNLKGKYKIDKQKIVKYPFKPFDIRCAYLDEKIAPLFSRPSPSLLKCSSILNNLYFITRDTADKIPEGPPFLLSKLICDYDSISGHARHFPCFVYREKKKSKDDDGMTKELFREGKKGETVQANLSKEARAYLKGLKISDPDTDREAAEAIWMHCLAIGYSGAYLTENADGIRQDWPRIPLPDKKKTLMDSAELGSRVAGLLDTEADASGVTGGAIRKEIGCIGLINRVGGGHINPDAGELDVTAGWGHAGKDGVCMPGKGKPVRRAYSEEEKKAMPESARNILGAETCDVFLNETVFVQNVPVNVWEYYIGGYQVIKKWLSYREKDMLGRGLKMEEAYYIRDMARRLAALVLLGPELDGNYARVKESTYPWPSER